MNRLFPLKITVIREGWRLFAVRNADKNFAPFKARVWERDDYTCCYCGFKSKYHQQVVNLDNNYANNKLSNLVTACCFCTQCLFLDMVGKSSDSAGVLIYLPELGQNDLNALCYVLFSTMYDSNNYGLDAQNIYKNLTDRVQWVEQRLGIGMSNPANFCQVLLEVSHVDRQRFEKDILSKIRLLPLYNAFIPQVSDWSMEVENDLSI